MSIQALPGSAKQCEWLPFVKEQLAAIAVLPEGWDSYGAASPDPRLVDAGRGLIDRLAQDGDLPQPHVNPTRNGGVQFEWEASDRYFELEVVDERTAEYLFCDEAGRVQETGSVNVEESLVDVVDYIRAVRTSG